MQTFAKQAYPLSEVSPEHWVRWQLASYIIGKQQMDTHPEHLFKTELEDAGARVLVSARGGSTWVLRMACIVACIL